MATSQCFSGARCVFKFDGIAVGYASGVTGSQAIQYTPIQTLGHLEVVEHCPVAYTVEFLANLARVATATRLNHSANFPSNRPDVEGTVSSPQIMPGYGNNGLNILISGELTASIYDIVTQKTLYTISGVKAAQKSWDIQATSIVSEAVTFVARFAGESDESTLPVGS